jgi:hypothetical protein
MSRNTIFVLMYHHHKLLDIISFTVRSRSHIFPIYYVLVVSISIFGLISMACVWCAPVLVHLLIQLVEPDHLHRSILSY